MEKPKKVLNGIINIKEWITRKGESPVVKEI